MALTIKSILLASWPHSVRLAQVSGTATVVHLGRAGKLPANAPVKPTHSSQEVVVSVALGHFLQAGGTDHEMKDAERSSNSSGEAMSFSPRDNGPLAMELEN